MCYLAVLTFIGNSKHGHLMLCHQIRINAVEVFYFCMSLNPAFIA